MSRIALLLAGSFTHDLHRKFLFFDFAARKRNIFSRAASVQKWTEEKSWKNLIASKGLGQYLRVITNDLQQRYHPLVLQRLAHHHVVDKYEIARMLLINLQPN